MRICLLHAWYSQTEASSKPSPSWSLPMADLQHWKENCQILSKCCQLPPQGWLEFNLSLFIPREVFAVWHASNLQMLSIPIKSWCVCGIERSTRYVTSKKVEQIFSWQLFWVAFGLCDWHVWVRGVYVCTVWARRPGKRVSAQIEKWSLRSCLGKTQRFTKIVPTLRLI